MRNGVVLFSEVFGSFLNLDYMLHNQQECGENVLGRRPLSFPIMNSSKAVSGPFTRSFFLALARVTITIFGRLVEFSENTP